MKANLHSFRKLLNPVAQMKKKPEKTAPAKHEPGHEHVHGPHCNHNHDLICELRIRQYKPEDFQALTLTWKASDIALDETDSAKALAENLKRNKNGFRVFVAEAQMVEQKTNKPVGESQIAGGVIATQDGHRAYVYHLGVHPEFRSVGLGKALLEACEEQASLWGARHLRLTSRTDPSRKAARQLYKEMGWSVEEGVCIYKKTLKKKS